MSDRERWTVYPLIFLTLGVALKDKLTRLVTADTVTCHALVVTDRQDAHQIELVPTANGGLIRTVGKPLNVLLGHTTPFAGLIFTDNADNVHIPSITVPNKTGINRGPAVQQQQPSPRREPISEGSP